MGNAKYAISTNKIYQSIFKEHATEYRQILKLSKSAKEDLIHIHHYGVKKFGINQADKYFNSFFEYFKIIAQRPYAFEQVDYIKKGYRRYACGSNSIYFKIINDTVEIMAIIGRQDLANIFD